MLYSQYSQKQPRVNAPKRDDYGELALKPLIPRLPPETCKHRRRSTSCQSMTMRLRLPALMDRSRYFFFFFFAQRTAKGRGISLASWILASNFTDNEVARIVECRCSSLVGSRKIRSAQREMRSSSLVLHARADIKFSKFCNVDSGHARVNILPGDFAPPGK